MPDADVQGLGVPCRDRIAVTFLTVIPSPYQRELFKALDRSGRFDLRVLYYKEAVSDRQWTNSHYESFEFVMPGTTLAPLGMSAHWNPGIRGLLNSRPSDLVIVSDYSAPTAQIAMHHLNRQRRPWAFWGEMPGFQQRGFIGSNIRRLLQAPLSGANAIVAIGSRAKSAYEKRFPEIPVFDIPYFCDLEPYISASADCAEISRCRILFSGQLIARKGVDILIAAFAQAVESGAELELILLGDGKDRETYERLVPEALRGRVTFMGFLQPEQLPSIFAEADVFVLPSRHDGWGLVINEAIGAGLAVIASDAVGAAHDLVEPGENGFIVRKGVVEDLASALILVGSDAALLARMKGRSREMSHRWGLHEAVRRWEAICSECAHKRVR